MGGAGAAGVPGGRRGVRALRGRGTDHRVRDRAGGDPAHPRASRAARGGRPGRTVGGSGGGSGLRARAWWVGEGRAPEGEREWARPRWGECAPGARGGGLRGGGGAAAVAAKGLRAVRRAGGGSGGGNFLAMTDLLVEPPSSDAKNASHARGDGD